MSNYKARIQGDEGGQGVLMEIIPLIIVVIIFAYSVRAWLCDE